MNKTIVNFHGRTAKAASLYQYDYGQWLILQGIDLPAAYEVHFALAGDEETVTVLGDDTGVLIPDELLTTGKTIYAYIYLHTGEDDGETEYKITVPVIERPEPTNEEPTPVQQDVITQTIAALNTAVEKVSQAVANSPKIVDGTWCVWDADNGEWVDTGVKAEGVDGVSPVITTEPIANGHRITFTDESGTHVIDITNGAKGDTGATGPQGEAGPTGATGADGISPTFQTRQITGGYRLIITDVEGTHSVDLMDGPKGETGDTGPKGDTGLQGPKGDTGATGQTGPQGAKGETGAQGPKGDDGADGKDGYTPVKGVDYFDGATGPQGPKGDTGETGATGPQGPKGDTGETGATGAQGPKGDTPVKGTDYWTPSDQQDIVDDVVDVVGVKTETVSGTTVSIVGVANTRYICGEVSTISITPPVSGIIDVIFSSGSTVAVLTLPQTVKMPSEFEVEANKTYELNIMDGVYGVVSSWT